jgi:hypothetical protein
MTPQAILDRFEQAYEEWMIGLTEKSDIEEAFFEGYLVGYEYAKEDAKRAVALILSRKKP